MAFREGLLVAGVLAGPGVVAVLGRLGGPPVSVGRHAAGVAAIAGLAALALAHALWLRSLRPAELGLVRPDRWTAAGAAGLTAFLVLVYGPLVQAAVAALSEEGFGAGMSALTPLPDTYLVGVVLVVASAEELIYRPYAIEVLTRLSGRRAPATALSIVAFALVHVPVWGSAAAASGLLAGAIFSAVWLLRRDLWLLIAAHIATDLCGLMLPRLTAG